MAYTVLYVVGYSEYFNLATKSLSSKVGVLHYYVVSLFVVVWWGTVSYREGSVIIGWVISQQKELSMRS